MAHAFILTFKFQPIRCTKSVNNFVDNSVLNCLNPTPALGSPSLAQNSALKSPYKSTACTSLRVVGRRFMAALAKLAAWINRSANVSWPKPAGVPC